MRFPDSQAHIQLIKSLLAWPARCRIAGCQSFAPPPRVPACGDGVPAREARGGRESHLLRTARTPR